MRNKLLFGFTAIAVVCMAFAVMLLTPNTAVVRAETVSGKTPTFSATKYLKSSDGSMMLLATGINDYDDCYECGYEIEGLRAVTYNTAKYYTSISAGGGAKTWTTEDIFGEEYDGMIVWEVKNISTETTFRPYVRVGDREDGVLVSSETVEYGTERSIDSVVGVTASYTGILLSEGLDDFASSGKALTFEYKATGASSGTDTVLFTLWTADGTQRLTGIYTLDVEANTLSGSAAKIEDIGDDWFRVTINCSDMPINTAEGADGTETIGQIFFNTVNRPVIIANAEFVDEDIHIGAHNFTTSASTYDFGASPSTSGVELDQVIIIDVKFATSGNFNFYLNEYYNPRYCGPFAVTSAGEVSGNGASIESIDGGWYRVKINLNKATKGGDPAFISRVNIQAGTATGYVKYIGYEEPDIHEDKVSFAASTAKDYYFVENYSTEGVALDKTILIDVKFTSAGTFVFYLNEYYYGRYCGPFTVNSNGTVSGAGASIESIDDGWYRVTIDIASTVKSATNPAFLSRINITNGGTGAGYVMYMGILAKTATVTVVNGTGGGTYEEGESVTVVANSPAANQEFFGWELNGGIVSSDSSYTFDFDASEDITLTALYSTVYSSGTSYVDFTLENWALSQKSVTFLFKKVTADATGSFQIRLCDSTKTALGYAVTVTLNADSASAGSPANIESIGDGWYRFILDPALLTKQAGKDGTETMKYLQIASVSTPIKVAEIDAVSMFKPRLQTYYDLPETINSYNSSSKYLTFKIKKVNASEAGTVEFKLSDGSSLSYGIRFTFVANEAPTVTGGNNRACTSVEDLGDGWYLITTQACSSIGGSAFNATKLYYNNYGAQKDFYLADLEIH